MFNRRLERIVFIKSSLISMDANNFQEKKDDHLSPKRFEYETLDPKSVVIQPYHKMFAECQFWAYVTDFLHPLLIIIRLILTDGLLDCYD